MIAIAAVTVIASGVAQAIGLDVVSFADLHKDSLIGIGLIGAISLPNGSIIAIASAYGASKNMTALTNANPGVATLEAAHGIATGEYFEITSGWSRLTDKIVKAGTVATNDVPLLGIDTSLTSIYPSGSGTGTVREISTWTQIAQVLSTQSDGGQQQFFTYQLLEADAEKRIPTTKSAGGLTIRIADDPALAGYIAASAANDDRLPRALRITMPNGSVLLYNAYVSLNKTPTFTVNQAMECEVTFSFLAEPVRYAA